MDSIEAFAIFDPTGRIMLDCIGESEADAIEEWVHPDHWPANQAVGYSCRRVTITKAE